MPIAFAMLVSDTREMCTFHYACDDAFDDFLLSLVRNVIVISAI